MTRTALFARKWVRVLGVTGAALAGYVFGITADRVTAQQPGKPAPDRRVVAYVYGNIPVTREELGDFLIARGGYEKLELLVNKRIIEIEAVKRSIGVTSTEVESGLNEDLKGMGITKEEFVKHILPRYHKTLYEWTEDVIKPRILLGKMCQQDVKVTEQDLQRSFDNRYGERRQAKIICWNKTDLKIAQKQWEEARKGDEDFDRVARTQADASLASATGRIAPLGKYPDTEDDTATKVLFSLQKGELSQLFETPAGIMCMKCEAIIPKDEKVKLEGKVRETLEKEVLDRKLSAAIPKFFEGLKKAAQPNLLLVGPPGPKEFSDGVKQGLQQIGATGTAPPAAPMPKP